MNIELEILYSGDSLDWTENLPLYPASEYELKYYLILQTNTPIVISSAAEGDIHRVSADLTGALPGEYTYQAKVTKNGKTTTIAQGTVEILANIAIGQDPRSYWKKVYDNLQAAYARLSSRDVTEITVMNRTYKYKDMHALAAQIRIAEVKAGIKKRTPRILESY